MLLILGTTRNTYLSGKIQKFCVLKQVTVVICRYTIGTGSVQNLIYDLHRVTEKMNIVYKIKDRKVNWTEGKIQGTRRRGRRCYQLLDDPKKERRYWTLKREALDSNLWRNRCGRGYGPIARMA
jgi:hypothetical protein